jgi:hypothetical protein
MPGRVRLCPLSLFQQTATPTRKIEILGSWQVCAHHGRAKLGELGEVAEGLRLTSAG